MEIIWYHHAINYPIPDYLQENHFVIAKNSTVWVEFEANSDLHLDLISTLATSLFSTMVDLLKLFHDHSFWTFTHIWTFQIDSNKEEKWYWVKFQPNLRRVNFATLGQLFLPQNLLVCKNSLAWQWLTLHTPIYEFACAWQFSSKWWSSHPNCKTSYNDS